MQIKTLLKTVIYSSNKVSNPFFSMSKIKKCPILDKLDRVSSAYNALISKNNFIAYFMYTLIMGVANQIMP